MSEPYVTPAGPIRAVVEELLRGGVRDVVICPGSRSTPMALALRAAPGLRCWVHLDERAGAFFALGAAKAVHRPAAILATSGTAAVNFAPAVVEARYGHVPLILLTADRPPELQGRGSPQTIDQVELYGRGAKAYEEIPVPQASEASEAEIRAIVARAVAGASSAPAGPVQLNLPFREPLLPAGPLAIGDVMDGSSAGRSALSTVPELAPVLEAIRGASRGLIVCGPLDLPGLGAVMARLAAGTGFPVLADGLSGLRNGAHDRSRVIAHHDALLRSPAFGHIPDPDFVLRFGGRPTSKVLAERLDALQAPQVLVAESQWNAPQAPALSCIIADPTLVAASLADAFALRPRDSGGMWLARWQAAEAAADDALRSWLGSLDEPFEGALFAGLDTVLPEGTVVFVGNSMPVRDLDSFLPRSGRSLRLLGNRGANGIDGLLSTALGVAAAQDQPVLAVVGDLSFLHDLTALAAAQRLGLEATIVLIDNDGGGIFSFLPQASADLPEAGLPAHFEELFGTAHGLDLGPLTTALGAVHVRVAHDQLLEAVGTSLGEPGLRVIELRTERGRNRELHETALGRVARAVEGSA